MTSKHWIYKNLTRRVWSSKINSTGRVNHIQNGMILYNVEFRVWKGALKSLRTNHKKTPCGFVIADQMIQLFDYQFSPIMNYLIKNKHIIQVNFFPYTEDEFTVLKNGYTHKVFKAPRALLTAAPELKVYIDDNF